MKLNIPNIKSLIKLGRIKEGHPLYDMPKSERTILDEAIGIAYSKYLDSGKEVNELLGSLCDRESYQGLLGELFWCYRLTQLGYSFKTESKEGQKDFRIKLENRIVGAEVKSIQKQIVSNQESDLKKRLIKSVHKLIDNNQIKCIIFIKIRRNFTGDSIKPIAKYITEVVEQISLSQKKYTLYYPEDSGDTYGCQAEVTIEPYKGKNHSIQFVHPTVRGIDDKLLKSRLKEAISQLDPEGVNVIFVDKTYRPILDKEDAENVLYGVLHELVSFHKETGKPISKSEYRDNDGFFKDTSRISAVIIYERNASHDLSGIRDYEIYPHPEHCKLTESEWDHLHKLCNV